MLTTTYKDYVIQFNESHEEWEVDGTNISSVTFRGAKAKIDRMDAELRKLGTGVPVFVIVWRAIASAKAVNLDAEEGSVWVKLPKGRRKEQLDCVVLDTPETRQLVDKYFDLCRKSDELHIQSSEILATIPRATEESLKKAASVCE